jgi:TolB-like protein/Flp pilus assembly protein TadD
LNPRSFFSELKRRNVYKVAVAYAVVGWLLVQVTTQVFPIFEIPNWALRLIVLAIIIGFPIALVIAWAFELTPEGIKRTEDVDPAVSTRQPRKHAWIFVIIVGALLSVGLFFVGRYTARSNNASSTELLAKSIAVLPFDNLSHDPDNAYFAEGVQDEILTRLAKVADLKVISRTSTQRFKSAPSDLREIAKQLGVMHILEGSVQKANDQVRVNVQLINATTDAHLWADTYDRKLHDIFAVESEIAKTIADTLQAKLTGAEQKAMSVRPTENTEAYQLYLKGRSFWNKRTAPDLSKSIDYFNQAIEKDAGYARAYAAMAQALLLLPAYNGGAPNELFPRAQAAAEKALALDNSLSEAHAVMAALKENFHFDHLGALAEFERTLKLNPNDATARQWMANNSLAYLGRSKEELEETKHALELDPLSLVINTNLGVAYFHNGLMDQAITQLRKTVDMDDSFYYAHWQLGLAYVWKGSYPEAIAELEKAASLSHDPVPMGILAYLYGLSGRKADAEKILDQLHQMREEHYTAAYGLAVACLGLGEKEQALHWLELGYQEHDGYDLNYIRIDPLLKTLHGDPRFEALAEKIMPAKIFKGAASP